MKSRGDSLFLLALLVMALTTGAVAGVPGGEPSSDSFSLSTVLDSVDRHFPLILSAAAEVEKQQGLYDSKKGAFDAQAFYQQAEQTNGYPENSQTEAGLKTQIYGTGLTASLSWDRLRGQVPSYRGEDATGSDGRWKGKLQIPLLNGLLIDANRFELAAGQLKISVAEQQARIVRMETYSKAAMAYWYWLSRVEKRKVSQNLVELALTRQDFIKKRVAHGDLAPIDEVENERMILQRKAQLLKDRQDEMNSALELSIYYRDLAGQPVLLIDKPAPQWLDHAVLQEKIEIGNKSSVHELPMIQKVEAEIKALQAEQSLRSQERLPKLDLILEESRYEGVLPPGRTDQRESYVGFQFSFPLFNFKALGQNKAAESALRSREIELRLMKDQLNVRFDRIRAELKTSRSVIENNFREIENSDKLAIVARKQFERGAQDLFLVNTRETEAANSRIKTIESLLDYRFNELQNRLLQNGWVRKF
jgi:outer membrane protein TolC